MRFEKLKKTIIDGITIVPGISAIKDALAPEKEVAADEWYQLVYITELDVNHVSIKIAITVYHFVRLSVIFEDLKQVIRYACEQAKISVEKIDIYIEGIKHV